MWISSKPQHSYSLAEATNSWSVNIDNGLLINGVVFIDLIKAFDTI